MSLRAWFLLAACSLLWGIPYLLIKVGVDAGASPALLAFGRTLLGAFVLLPLAVRRGTLPSVAPLWRGVLVLGALDFALPFVLLGIAEREISSSFTGILIATVPLLIVVLAIWVDPSERVRGTPLGGLVVGFAGVCLLLGVEVSGSTAALVAAGLVLLASLSYAAATLYLKRAFSGGDPVAVVAASLTAAAVMVAPLALVDPGATPGSDGALLSIALLGVLCSAGAYVAYYALVQVVGASRAAINTYISPAIAVALGIAILDEPLTAGSVAGMLVILAGSWFAAGGTPPRVPSQAPEALDEDVALGARLNPVARRRTASRPSHAGARP